MTLDLRSLFPPGSRRRNLAFIFLFLVVVLLFLVANRGAYKGYFSDDDLDNLGNAQVAQFRYYVVNLLTPRLNYYNFRPTGHFVYYAMERLAGLNFPRYITLIQTMHLLNVLLVWVLLRRLGATTVAACGGTLFFVFEMASFDIYWKPMYVFDLFCAFFCLLSILAYLHQRFVLAIIGFWFAYKAKEVAIMLPMVLAACEYWIGGRRWRRLIPFFVISLTFGLQALFANQTRDNLYTLRFSPKAIWQCVDFYSSQIFGVPQLGLGLLALPFAVRDKLFRFGFASFCVLLIPMLVLPGRLFAAYLYVPYIGLAIAVAALAMRANPGWIVLFFALWLPWNYSELRQYRKAKLAADDEVRNWATTVGQFVHQHPDVNNYFYSGRPANFNVWGMAAVLHYNRPPGPSAALHPFDSAEAEHMSELPALALLRWDTTYHKVTVIARTADSPDAPVIRMNVNTPVWQLIDGWFALEGYFRWTKPHAVARLWRPADAREFAVSANVAPGYLKEVHQAELVVRIDGKEIGRHTFTQFGWQTVRWKLPEAPTGDVQVEFLTPPFRPNRTDEPIYGMPIGAFGFVTPGHDIEWPPK